MAESNTARLSLRRWSAGTDTPARIEFDTDNANLETLVAIDKQDTFVNRPAAGVRGTYFWDTTNELLWRDSGAAWSLPGSKGRDGYFKSSTTATVPLTVDTPASQTANLFELKVNGAAAIAYFTKDGNLTAGTYAGKSAAFVNTVDATVALSVKGSASQSANLFELKNTGDVKQLSVSNTGIVQSSYFRSGTTSTLNAAASTTVASMASWTGTGSLEVKSAASGTFNDFIYFKHDAFTGGAASRRFGLLMKVGGEDATGAGRSTALYMLSTAADFDTPSFQIDVRDQNLWSMAPVTGSVTPYPVYSNGGYLRATPTGTGGLRLNNTWMGTQNSGNSQYHRVATTGHAYYWYAGGDHSEAQGDAGTGGVMLMSLQPSASFGVITAGRLNLLDVQDASAAQANPTFMIGYPSGPNVIVDDNEIMARNNGVEGQLLIQADGGQLYLGNSLDTKVVINGRGFNISVGGTQPPSPTTNDIWLDGRVGEGLKVRTSGGVWAKLNP